MSRDAAGATTDAGDGSTLDDGTLRRTVGGSAGAIVGAARRPIPRADGLLRRPTPNPAAVRPPDVDRRRSRAAHPANGERWRVE